MKIGLFSPYDFDSYGGVNDHVSHLNEQFRRSGIDSRIIAPSSRSQSDIGDDFIPMGRPVPVPSGGSIARVSLSVWIRPKVWRLMEREKFDVVHLHEPFASAVTLSALTFNFGDIPIKVGTYHTFKGSHLYKFISGRILRRYSDLLHGQIAVSEPARAFISAHIPGDYKVIPNGIDVKKFSKASPFPRFADSKTNILFLGRLEKRKGLRYLLDAYSGLKWEFPNTRLIVVGGGNLDAESLRILGERNPGDVIFTGEVSESDKCRYFATADIFCAPATGQESFGIVLLEAMASKTAIVASDIVGFSQVVHDGQESLLFKSRNVQSLKESLIRLVNDKTLRNRLGNNARIKVEQYRWENIAVELIDYYRILKTADSAKGLANVL